MYSCSIHTGGQRPQITLKFTKSMFYYPWVFNFVRVVVYDHDAME